MFTDYLDETLGDNKDIGHEKRYNCPFCDDTEHKLYVSSNGDHSDGLWICFHCGKKGNPISFVMRYENIRFNDAKEVLEMYDYSLGEYTGSDNQSLTDEERMLLFISNINKAQEEEKKPSKLTPPNLPIGYKRIVDNLNNKEVIPFLMYLKKRGFSFEDIVKHNIGYITDGYVESSNGNKVNLSNHLVFLTHSEDGSYRYWNTRSIVPNPSIKSFNGLSKDNEYSKKNSVFNLNQAVVEPEIYIVEGVPDALTLGNRGVATFGKQVTEDQVDLIVNSIKEDQKLYIMLDMDAKKEMSALADKLYSRHKETYLVLNDTYKDANDLGRDKAIEIIKTKSVRANEEGKLLLLMA